MSKDNQYFSINIRGGIDDVFHNSFDITWAKTGPDQDPTKRLWTKLPIENAEDDGSVVYEYNSDFFRCDDFSKNHSEETHVLFAGCSQTEGVGAPLETVWTKMLLQELGSNSKFYSIAKAGFGWQKIITNFMIYVEKYGAPEYLFILLPNLGRFFIWENESFVYVQRYPNKKTYDNGGRAKGVLEEQDLTENEHKRSFVDFSISWKLFEKYCESIGTKLLWSSWDYNENKNYKLANISKNYIDLSAEKLMDYIRLARPDGKMLPFDISRRDGHAGVLVNEYWAAAFKEEISNRGWKC